LCIAIRLPFAAIYVSFFGIFIFIFKGFLGGSEALVFAKYLCALIVTVI